MKYAINHWRMLACLFVVGVFGIATTQQIDAQDVVLEKMPASVVNQPDFDLYGLKRPALSITGFDNQAPGYQPAFGLGLKQILEARFTEHNPMVVPVFDRLIELARAEQLNPYIVGGDDLLERRVQLNRNTAILQGRAFEALATFVLELNGYDPPALHPELRSHGTALEAFRVALASPPGGLIYGDWLDDYVKYGRSVANVARSVDLYLALENAYVQVLAGTLPPFPGLRPDLLLTEAERVALMTEFSTALIVQETVLTTRAVDLYASDLIDILPPDVVEDLLEQLSHLPAGQRTVEEVEAGNWAMKQRASAGYGALVMQIDAQDPYAPLIRGLREKAFESMGITHRGDKSRRRHWNWMTYSGQRFWPESTYYLDFALEEVLAFWHATRANGVLDGRDDPFFSSWFTNALDWHADLATPDGRFAAMDDGNKTAYRYSGLMRWDGGYGDAELGRKYAWIEERLDGPARRDETLLLELAIPRTSVVQSPARHVGNTREPLQVNRSEQQLVVRSTGTADDTHFLFLNGEHGIAVERGEGHEQADQLNLLYYVGDASYLADSGYDQGYTVDNSFWNHYYDHNVMTIGGGEGGLDAPMLNILDVRKQSEPEDMGQVRSLFFENHGMVTTFHGEQQLHSESDHRVRADYARDVLFIDGEDPYVIDINGIHRHNNKNAGKNLGGARPTRSGPGSCEPNAFRMLYHVNSDDAIVADGYSPRQDGFLRWNNIDQKSGTALELFPMSVEFDLASTETTLVPDQILEEEDSNGKVLTDIRKLVLSNVDRCDPHWTVAALLHPASAAIAREDPDLLWPASNKSAKQGWVWERDTGSLDVFVARSVASPKEPVYLNLSDVNATYPDFPLTLPSGLAYGFARVVEIKDGWVLDSNYTVGLEGAGSSRRWMTRDIGVSNNSQIPYGLSNTYPNPASPNASFTVRLATAEVATVAVFDVTGRKVATLHSGLLAAETPYWFTIDGKGWASGLYFVRLHGERTSATRSMLLSH